MSYELKNLFDIGLHCGLSRSRRHPTAASFVHTTKDRADIFDLEEVSRRLEAATAFVRSLGGAPILFVGGKHEVAATVKNSAEKIGAPYVAGRWIGGTLTNFKNIRKRIDRLGKLTEEREQGLLDKYTKKERLRRHFLSSIRAMRKPLSPRQISSVFLSSRLLLQIVIFHSFSIPFLQMTQHSKA
jgi:small subunit ribosomal protein S2